jgi:hypothetical protein
MSSSKNSECANGTITLKSFSELANVLDLQSLPPGPADSDEAASTIHNSQSAPAESIVVEQSDPTPAPAPQNLASLMAQLASVSTGLETMARQDARAREQATIELAQYETLAAERQEAERGVAEAPASA